MAPNSNIHAAKSTFLMIFLSATHSSTNYTKLYLSLGLSEVLTKHLIAGTSIASGRMCKDHDLDDGLLMPKLSYINDVVTQRQGLKKRIFSKAARQKKRKKGGAR